MSNYISKSALLDFLKEEIKQDRPDDFKIRNIQRYIEDMPTLDEKEIIRKPFERVVECLNEKLINADLECASWKNKSSALFRCADSKRIAYAEAIEIVKEECGINV